MKLLHRKVYRPSPFSYCICDRKWFGGIPAYVLLLTMSISSTLWAKAPSNANVEKELDDITADDGYRWLREGGEKRNDASPRGKKGRFSGNGRGSEGDVNDEGGCQFEPNFQDWTPPEPDDANDGCGNSASPDCACNPDLGNCDCSPLTGSCGACAPSPGMLAPLGYGMGGLALALIIFFVVRALIRRMPAEDLAFESEEVDFDDDEIRMSRIHRVDPRSLMERARDAAAAGEYKRAVGYLYLLSLSILSRAGMVELDKSTTNWNVLRQTLKNGGPIDAVRTVVRHFEDLFFGDKEASEMRYTECHHCVIVDLLPLEKEETTHAWR